MFYIIQCVGVFLHNETINIVFEFHILILNRDYTGWTQTKTKGDRHLLIQTLPI